MAHSSPTEVEYVERQEKLVIRFDDGDERTLCCTLLRGFCPCARCQGHGGGPPRYVAPTTGDAIRINEVYPIGNYALGIQWRDGHDTGIYAFDVIHRWPKEWKAESMTVGQPLVLESEDGSTQGP